jgi:hypothetical protein
MVKLAGKVTRVSAESKRNSVRLGHSKVFSHRTKARGSPAPSTALRAGYRQVFAFFCPAPAGVNQGNFPRRPVSRWIPGPTCDTLSTCRQGKDFNQETGAHFHAQAHISTESPQTRENPWLPRSHEDQGWRSRAQPPSRHGPQARVGQRWLPRLTLPCSLFQAEFGSI